MTGFKTYNYFILYTLIAFLHFLINNLLRLWDIIVQNKFICVSPYPDGKNIAFSIVDDTDLATLENIKPIYKMLAETGMKTTKTVWVFNAKEIKKITDNGDTLERVDYLQYILGLKDMGFEIAMHTASGGSNDRDSTIDAYEKFKSVFGEYPKMNIMHSQNRDNIYWNSFQVDNKKTFQTPLIEYLYKRWDLHQKRYDKKETERTFFGEVRESKYFWGDICQKNTKYVRAKTYAEDMNTLKFDPLMPYYNPQKEYVKYWFSFSRGDNSDDFRNLISDENINRLKSERGLCIVCTHFGKGFLDINGYVKPEIRHQLEKISRLDGWFATVSDMLDRLLLLKNVSFKNKNGILEIHNKNNQPVNGLTLIARHFKNNNFKCSGEFQKKLLDEVVINLLPNEKVTITGKVGKNYRSSYWFFSDKPNLVMDLFNLKLKLYKKINKIKLENK